ncbi:hypothetical protein G5714_008697 [Onychostoma macrolepis]|uniref:Uncharacterized protein n=1 Tax=Onychostoma macrolepis TaxID=369639 RepID=A0A7J6CWF1_9TELE|nr:hypothetical protein G5714_008697 [Onychostoma macrolepis]
MRARRSLDSAVGQHLKTPSLSPAKFVEKRVGRRNDGDGLPTTKGVSDVSPPVILPCGWLRLSTNTGFSVPVPARCEREDRPERNPCPPTPTVWSLVEEGFLKPLATSPNQREIFRDGEQ